MIELCFPAAEWSESSTEFAETSQPSCWGEFANDRPTTIGDCLASETKPDHVQNYTLQTTAVNSNSVNYVTPHLAIWCVFVCSLSIGTVILINMHEVAKPATRVT